MGGKVKKNLPLFLGIIGAVIIGFLEGVGLEQAISDQIFRAFRSGDIVGFFAYGFIFVLLYMQVKGLKKAVERLNETIANSFARGETRFSEIEHRLTVLEHKKS